MNVTLTCSVKFVSRSKTVFTRWNNISADTSLLKEIQDKFAHLMDDLKCALCHSIFKQKHSLVMHIGCKHGKINEILKEKNFQVLPAPILSNPSSSMQKKLQMVKKERFDSDSNAPQQEETLMETTSGTSENTEIDKILKKYNFSASLSK